MPILSNTNRSPWFDDFSPNQNYHRVMFNAGRPVQARELTGLQSILQNQIEEVASRFFKNGDAVVNGGFGLGFERLVMFTTGMSNIRDVIPYPRTPQNASF